MEEFNDSEADLDTLILDYVLVTDDQWLSTKNCQLINFPIPLSSPLPLPFLSLHLPKASPAGSNPSLLPGRYVPPHPHNQGVPTVGYQLLLCATVWSEASALFESSRKWL